LKKTGQKKGIQVAEQPKPEGAGNDDLTSLMSNEPSHPLDPTKDLSAEDLDHLIEEQDPEFAQSLKTIAEDKNLTMLQEDESKNKFVQEIENWKYSEGWRSKVGYFAPLIPVIVLLLKIALFHCVYWTGWTLSKIATGVHVLAVEGRKGLVHLIRFILSWALGKLKAFQKAFSSLSVIRKIIFMFFLVLCGGLAVLVRMYLKGGFLPAKTDLFLNDLSKVSSQVYSYDSSHDLEPFYENLRVAQNLFLIPKLLVNIKPSSKSGKNPMAAFEFFLQGVSPEVVVELKDREVEFKDAIARTAEDFDFDVLDTIQGKKLLCDRIKKEVNLRLTTGKVRQVLIKTVIIKP
jgi:flagellar basal body-associated protein FliL